MANAVFNKLNSSMRKHTFKFQDTYQTKGGPEIQQNTRSQREVSIGSNRAANQAVYQAFNISAISYRVVTISRHQNSWTTKQILNSSQSHWSMHAELSRQHLKVLRKTTEAATTFTLRSSLQHFFLWARAQHTTDSSENQPHNRC